MTDALVSRSTIHPLIYMLGAIAFLAGTVARAQGSAAATNTSADSMQFAVVTYISGTSVYVSAGRSDGVREGATLEVFRNSATIATLRAVFLSSSSVSCEVVASTAPVAVGDSVRFRPVIDKAVSSADSSGPRSSAPPRRRPGERPIRGQVGMRYLVVTQSDTAAATVAQPAADLRITGSRLGGTSFGLTLDARSRRSISMHRDARTEQTGRTQVFQASLAWQDERSHLRFALGRQYSTTLTPVSLFDGVMTEIDGQHWKLGLLAGTQPELSTMALSSTVREYGAYAQVHNAQESRSIWSFTAGGISSHQEGELNREFVFLQASASGRGASVYITQELDVNRGWKRAAGEPAVSPTSTFASVYLRVADALSLQGGFDNRRNVRLYRDYVNPETEFDDSFRQGVWGGMSLLIANHLRLSGDARMSHGGLSGDATYYVGTFAIDRISRLRLGGRLRSTQYQTDRTNGWLHSGAVSAEPLSGVRIELNGGTRTEDGRALPQDPLQQPALHTRSSWSGIDLDLSLGRRWYFILSGVRERGVSDRSTQVYGSLVFRF